MERGYRYTIPSILVILAERLIKSMPGESSRCSLYFMGHQKPRGLIVQREEGVSMVLPCAMVPQIVLYGIEGRERTMTVI